MKLSRSFLFVTIFATIGFFILTNQASAYTQLDISIINDRIYINNCGANVGGTRAYREYVNDVEVWNTGQSGGSACFGGGPFLSGLISEVNYYANATEPWHLAFVFHQNSSLLSPIVARFYVYSYGSTI